MHGIGIVGYGYWGPNLARNFSEAAAASVLSICDRDEQRLAVAKQRLPLSHMTRDYEELLNNPEIDAIAISTPVSSHFELASRALNAGKHVFVEKPLTKSIREAETLVELAEKRGLVLHVDHTFVYTGAVRKIREIIQKGELGELYYYDSVRINLGLFQHDVDVLWDLAVHDIAIMDYIFAAKPVAVSAAGTNHVPGKPANITFLTLFFESGAVAHVHVNWLAPVKVRRTLVCGSRKMVVYDDLEPSEKVKIYDKGVNIAQSKEDIYEAMLTYRSGDMWAPQLDAVEALRLEVQHFLECIDEGKKPITDGQAGLRVVRVLEAASKSLKERGRPVELNGEMREKGKIVQITA